MSNYDGRKPEPAYPTADEMDRASNAHAPTLRAHIARQEDTISTLTAQLERMAGALRAIETYTELIGPKGYRRDQQWMLARLPIAEFCKAGLTSSPPGGEAGVWVKRELLERLFATIKPRPDFKFVMVGQDEIDELRALLDAGR